MGTPSEHASKHNACRTVCRKISKSLFGHLYTSKEGEATGQDDWVDQKSKAVGRSDMPTRRLELKDIIEVEHDYTSDDSNRIVEVFAIFG